MGLFCMSFQIKKFSVKKCILFSMLSFFLLQTFESVASVGTHSFLLERAHAPTTQSIAHAQSQMFKRSIKKYAVTAGVAVSAAVVLWTAYQVKSMLQEKEENRMKEVAKQTMQDMYESKNCFVVRLSSEEIERCVGKASASHHVAKTGFFNSLRGMASSGSRFFADSAFMLTSSMILSGAAQYMQQKVSQAFQDETVLWFLNEQTKINHIFGDLKNLSIEYDVHASLLSSEVFNQDAQIHMKAFVQDLLQTTRDYTTDNVFHDSQYLSFLLGEMKKKYARQAGELEALQSYVVPAIGVRQRSINGSLNGNGKEVGLFVSDAERRKEIASLCQLFVKEVERLTSFMVARLDKKSDKIDSIVSSCNAYVGRMETMLNASLDELGKLSKADCGMFTCSYEFERVFMQQVGHVHRYCKLIE